MAKYLIVNADDFGMCKAANDAVIALFKAGRLYSSTIMFPCPACAEAARFAADNPQYAVGVHFTLTSEWKTYRWAPLTDGASLRDPAGFMWPRAADVEKHAKHKEIEAEIEAQYEKALSFGMTPSHVDNHMGSLYGNKTGRLDLLPLVLRWAGKHGLSYRLYTKAAKTMVPRGTPWPLYKLSSFVTALLAKRYRVTLPDYLLFPDWTDELENGGYENYRKEILRQWTNIPDGVTETFLHPALETQELKEITPNWFQRVWEYNLMNDPETHAYLAANGVQMISYRELGRQAAAVKKR
ncbi:MAG: polysaccharide deacetylase family protein [Clostridia bacterium]|nr:polysaccharide deacetylase family protein [Clostridia bacterium]